MAGRAPGTTCQVQQAQWIDCGTLCLARSPSPACIFGGDAEDERKLRDALAALQAEAETFAMRYLQDARARRSYVERIAASSRELLRDVQSGAISAEEAARVAHGARETIMRETREITSAIGRAGAEAMKGSGPTLEQALDKAVAKHFPGKTFGELAAAQKRTVFMEVVEASGRSRPAVTAQIPKWTRFGRGLAVVTFAISAYNIWQAKNRLRQSVQEGATLGGGALGGALGGAAAGLVCGPGAPVCVTALFVIGGIVGAVAASHGAEWMLDQKEVVAWLGD